MDPQERQKFMVTVLGLFGGQLLVLVSLIALLLFCLLR